jgi:hypothetical protein
LKTGQLEHTACQPNSVKYDHPVPELKDYYQPTGQVKFFLFPKCQNSSFRKGVTRKYADWVMDAGKKREAARFSEFLRIQLQLLETLPFS